MLVFVVFVAAFNQNCARVGLVLNYRVVSVRGSSHFQEGNRTRFRVLFGWSRVEDPFHLYLMENIEHERVL